MTEQDRLREDAKAVLEREFPGDEYRLNPNSIDFLAGMIKLNGLRFAYDVVDRIQARGQQRMAFYRSSRFGVHPNPDIGERYK